MKQNFTILHKIRKVFTNEKICSDLFFYAPGGAPGLSRSRIWGPVPGFGPGIPGFGPGIPGFGLPFPALGPRFFVILGVFENCARLAEFLDLSKNL